jgi:hypothetical protein
MTVSKTAQQIKNLEDALVWWQTVPEANVYRGLAWYTVGDTSETSCKTVACFGGWCARWPGLIAQGLSLDKRGSPRGPGPSDLFGEKVLWSSRGSCAADAGFTGSDHALVTNRIRWALARA